MNIITLKDILLHPLSYLTIIRPPNVVMAAGAVFLGAWIGSSDLPFGSISILAVVAACATSFGNVINDILDVKTDLINHPDRPIPTGRMSCTEAKIYSSFLFG